MVTWYNLRSHAQSHLYSNDAILNDTKHKHTLIVEPCTISIKFQTILNMYVTKDHTIIHTMLFKFKMAFSLVP